MFEMNQDKGGFGDRADATGVQADASQGLECGLGQGVGAYADAVPRMTPLYVICASLGHYMWVCLF